MVKLGRAVMLCGFLAFAVATQFTLASFIAPTNVEAAKKKKKSKKRAKTTKPRSDNEIRTLLYAYCKKTYSEAATIRVVKRFGEWKCIIYE